ncbi:MAG: PLDc N-terminal domain-containing protein [Cytophagales bacterium]|nr:PLDc N-terminal domain-containing protein [Cytophagales bacterium]
MGTIFYIIGVICAVWVIYDVWAVNKKLSTAGKMIWSIFAILFSVITAIVYYFIGRK